MYIHWLVFDILFLNIIEYNILIISDCKTYKKRIKTVITQKVGKRGDLIKNKLSDSWSLKWLSGNFKCFNFQTFIGVFKVV